MIRNIHPGSDFFHPGFRSQIRGSKCTVSAMPDPDPQHWFFQCCGSALASMKIRFQLFLSPYGSGSRKPNQCGYGFWTASLYIRRCKSLLERSTVKFWSITMLLDPDLHSQYGSKTSKSMRIQVNPDPQHWFSRVKINLFATLVEKSGQGPGDPDWFGSLDPDPHWLCPI